MKLIAALFLLTTVNAFPAANDNSQIQICSNLMAARSVSELEQKSYYARGYGEVTSVYMRVALNHVLSHLDAVKSAQLEADPLIDSVTESVRFEINDSYSYATYRISTASRVFNKIASDVNVLERSNSCL